MASDVALCFSTEKPYKGADAALPETVYRRVGRFGNDYMATRRISPPR
jgi:hypothetical protein